MGRLIAAIVATLAGLVAVVVVVAVAPEPENAAGLDHALFDTMKSGGSGAARVDGLLGVGWGFGALQVVFFSLAALFFLFLIVFLLPLLQLWLSLLAVVSVPLVGVWLGPSARAHRVNDLAELSVGKDVTLGDAGLLVSAESVCERQTPSSSCAASSQSAALRAPSRYRSS